MDSLTQLIDVRALLATVASYAPQVLAAIIIFIAFRAIYKVSRIPLIGVCNRIDMEEPVIKLLIDTIYKYAVLIFGGLVAAKQLGIDVGAVLAGMGVAGIAIGFAAQDTLSNIIAGFIIFLDKPFKLGDWIKIDEYYGEVHEITMRSTRVRTEDNTYVIIPNKTIIDEYVDNRSKYGHLRVMIELSIAYEASIDTAREALLAAARAVPAALTQPPVLVSVVELGDSGVLMEVEIWIEDAEKEEPTRDLLTELSKKALDEAGVEIPYPHVHLVGAKPS